MSEYGGGVSLTQAFNYDKERLLKAISEIDELIFNTIKVQGLYS